VQNITQKAIEDADELLLDTVACFVGAHGGVAECVGGIHIMQVSPQKFCVCVWVEGDMPTAVEEVVAHA
jgi:hypothetical protein